MATVQIVNGKEAILTGEDNIVIAKYISGIKGGRALDVTGVTAKVIKAGHVIITDGNGNYKPMPLTTSNGVEVYDSLPDGWSYAGVLVGSILTSKASASIMTNGEVNEVATPYSMTAIKAAFLSACPHIAFVRDDK